MTMRLRALAGPSKQHGQELQLGEATSLSSVHTTIRRRDETRLLAAEAAAAEAGQAGKPDVGDHSQEDI